MKKVFLLLIAILLNAKSVVDSLNRKIDIPNNIDKVVAMGPGALRLIVYLNSQDKVVGIEKREHQYIKARPYILAHKELLKLPIIGRGGVKANPNLEKILSLKPDVIIAGYISKKEADLITKKTGIPVIVISYGDLGTFSNKILFNSIYLLGEVFNKQKRAKKVVNFVKNLDEDIKKRKFECNKKVYIGAVAFKGLHGITSTMPKFPPFEMLGIKNIINANTNTHIFINKESLLKIDPDIIFLDESGMKFVKKDFNLIKHLKAYKTKNIYGILPYNNYMTNIGTAYLNTYYIGKVLNKEFDDIDIEKKANEIYTFLVGKNVYNEMKEFFGGFKKLFISN